MGCVSAILSHAAGVYSLMIAKSTIVSTAVDMVAGQSATIRGTRDDLDGSVPVWSYVGSDAAFRLGAGSHLEMFQVREQACSLHVLLLGSKIAPRGDAICLPTGRRKGEIQR